MDFNKDLEILNIFLDRLFDLRDFSQIDYNEIIAVQAVVNRNIDLFDRIECGEILASDDKYKLAFLVRVIFNFFL